MGSLKSNIPELLSQKGWDTRTFVAYCMLAGLSERTGYRLARGDTNVTTDTLLVVAKVLGVDSLSSLIGVENNGNEQA